MTEHLEAGSEPRGNTFPLAPRRLPSPALLAFFAFLVLLAAIGLNSKKPAGRSVVEKATAEFVIRAAFALRPFNPNASAFLLRNIAIEKTASEAIEVLTDRRSAGSSELLAPIASSGKLHLSSFKRKIHAAIPYRHLQRRILVRALQKEGKMAEAADLLHSIEQEGSRTLLLGIIFGVLYALALPTGIAAIFFLARLKPVEAEATLPPAAGIFPFIAWIVLLLATSLLIPAGGGASWSLLALLALYSLSGFAVTAIALRLLPAIRPTTLLGLRGVKGHCLRGLQGYFAAIPLILCAQLAWSAVVKQQGGSRNLLLPLILESGTAMRLVIIVLVALLAPVIEEIIFRGLLYPALRSRFRRNGAIFLTAAAFATAHLDFPILLPLFVLGFLLAWLRARTGSIIPGCVTHALWNLQTFVLLVILTSGRTGSVG